MDKFVFKRSTYKADDSTYIRMETPDGEPWCDVTVCLAGYGMTPESEDFIFIPSYKMDQKTIDYIMDKLVDKIIINEIPIGYATGMYVKLVDDWKSFVEEL